MKIRKRTGIAIGVLAASTMLIAPAAFATSSILTVDGLTSTADVDVTGDLKGTIAFETDFEVPASCTTAAVDGYVKRGVNVANGVKIGAIENLQFGDPGNNDHCLATELDYPVIIEKSANVGDPAEWGIYAIETPGKSDVEVDVEIRGVVAKMHSTNVGPWACDLEATGTVAGKFNQSTQELTISTAPNFPLAITAFDGSGTKTPSLSDRTCGGQIYTGDNASMAGVFTLDTPGVGGITF